MPCMGKLYQNQSGNKEIERRLNIIKTFFSDIDFIPCYYELWFCIP